MAKVYSQEVYAVGKVVWGNYEAGKETKNGKVYDQYTILVQTPEGVGLAVEKRIWNPDQPKHEWIEGKLNEFMSIIENYKEENIYVSISVQPHYKKKTMFDTFTTWEKDNGGYGIKCEGFPTILKVREIFKKDADGDTVIDNKGKEVVEDVIIEYKSKDVKLSESKTKIELSMIVGETNGQQIMLVSEDVEYPTTVYVELAPEVENKAKQFTAYRFKCKLHKGEKLETSNVDNDWEEEAPESSFAPNSVRVESVLGVVKGLTIGGQEFPDETEDVSSDF